MKSIMIPKIVPLQESNMFTLKGILMILENICIFYSFFYSKAKTK